MHARQWSAEPNEPAGKSRLKPFPCVSFGAQTTWSPLEWIRSLKLMRPGHDRGVDWLAGGITVA